MYEIFNIAISVVFIFAFVFSNDDSSFGNIFIGYCICTVVASIYSARKLYSKMRYGGGLEAYESLKTSIRKHSIFRKFDSKIWIASVIYCAALSLYSFFVDYLPICSANIATHFDKYGKVDGRMLAEDYFIKMLIIETCFIFVGAVIGGYSKRNVLHNYDFINIMRGKIGGMGMGAIFAAMGGSLVFACNSAIVESFDSDRITFEFESILGFIATLLLFSAIFVLVVYIKLQSILQMRKITNLVGER